MVTDDCGVVRGVEANFEQLGDREQRDKMGCGGTSLRGRWGRGHDQVVCEARLCGAWRGGEVGGEGGGGSGLGAGGEEGGGI